MSKNQDCFKNYSTELSNSGDKKKENVLEVIDDPDENTKSWRYQMGRESSQTTLSTTEGGSSSSSSLGWSDEYEGSTTRKIFDELKKMDRVLKGEETIPSHYDADEYEQWMNKFPNVSIFDSSDTPVNSTQDITGKLRNEMGDSFTITGSYTGPRNNCDKDTSNSHYRKKLISMRLSEISPSRLLNQRGANITRKKSSGESEHKNRNVFTVFNKTKSWDSEKYLKISSISSLINERKHSSKSLLNRQISKEYADSSLEFDSLPFIEVEEAPTEEKHSHHNNQKSVSSTRKNYSDHLVLPPINASNQFRSISATPRQPTKTFSALSVNSNILLERKKVMRKSLNAFLETPKNGFMKRNNLFR